MTAVNIKICVVFRIMTDFTGEKRKRKTAYDCEIDLYTLAIH